MNVVMLFLLTFVVGLENVKYEMLNEFKALLYCKIGQVSKSSQVKLTFIGCSGPNCSMFYLFWATSAGLSATLSHAHA